MKNIAKLLSQLTNENKYYIKIETDFTDDISDSINDKKDLTYKKMEKDQAANSTNTIIVTIIKLKGCHNDEFIFDAMDFFDENNPVIARCKYGIVMACNNKQTRKDIIGNFCDYYPIYDKCLICAEQRISEEDYIMSAGMNLMHLVRFFAYVKFKYERVLIEIEDEK